jgi:hypothetical protein
MDRKALHLEWQSNEVRQPKESILDPRELYAHLEVREPNGETYSQYLEETVEVLWATILWPTRTNQEKPRPDKSPQLYLPRQEFYNILIHNLQHLLWLNFLEREEKRFAIIGQKEENELSQKQNDKKRKEDVEDSVKKHSLRKNLYISNFITQGETPDKNTRRALELLATGAKESLISYLMYLKDHEMKGPSVLINKIFEPAYEIQVLINQLNNGLIRRRQLYLTYFESIFLNAPNEKERRLINSLACGEMPIKSFFNRILFGWVAGREWKNIDEFLKRFGRQLTLEADELKVLLSNKEIPLQTGHKLKEIAKLTWLEIEEASPELQKHMNYAVAVKNNCVKIGINSFNEITHFQTALYGRIELEKLKFKQGTLSLDDLEIVDDANILDEHKLAMGMEVMTCSIGQVEIATNRTKNYLFIEPDIASLAAKIESYFLIKQLNLVDFSSLKDKPLEEFLSKEYKIDNIQINSKNGLPRIEWKNKGAGIVIELEKLEPRVYEAIKQYLENIEQSHWGQITSHSRGFSR